MRILIAPNAFKDCLDAVSIARILARAFSGLSSDIETDELPVADGGDGFAPVLSFYRPLFPVAVDTYDALMRPLTANIRTSGGLCFIESANACGLRHLTPTERDAGKTTSFGVGSLIKKAVETGATDIVLGLGGSATNDCGAGAMQALGAKLYDASGVPIPDGATGSDLSRIAKIDLSGLSPSLFSCHYTMACDVDNPLTGTNGAAAIFAPQKGANAETIAFLERGATDFCRLLEKMSGKTLATAAGAGAAGGLSVPFDAFFNVRRRRGIDIVLNAADFDAFLKKADLVVTGEGAVDGSTLNGKAPDVVAFKAAAANVPCATICGKGIFEQVGKKLGSLYQITPPDTPFETAVEKAPEFLRETARRILTGYRTGNIAVPQR